MEGLCGYTVVGIYLGFVLFVVACILSERYKNQKKKFEKFDGHLGYLIHSNMSRWIRTDIDNMQRKIDETNPGSPVQKQQKEQLKPEITPQDRQEQIQPSALKKQDDKRQQKEQLKPEITPQDCQEQMQPSALKKQDDKRQQKEQIAAIKQYWKSVQPELKSFSQSSDDVVKKTAGMKILEISEENFSLDYLKQQYLHVLTDYVQPLQESDADKTQKEKVLETVYHELYGWAI